MDLSYLLEDKYATHFANIVKKAKPVFGADLVLKAYNIDGDVRIRYEDQSDFENIARQFGIFQEWKVKIGDIPYTKSVLSNGGNCGAIAEWRGGFMANRHTAWLQWRICDGGAIAAAMTMAAWRKLR
ncbi:Glycosyl transferase, family 13 [Sesbania bispinosa]|nr:Glycosyl transferase, family 13 [Sesbania bispinosa]